MKRAGAYLSNQLSQAGNLCNRTEHCLSGTRQPSKLQRGARPVQPGERARTCAAPSFFFNTTAARRTCQMRIVCPSSGSTMPGSFAAPTKPSRDATACDQRRELGVSSCMCGKEPCVGKRAHFYESYCGKGGLVLERNTQHCARHMPRPARKGQASTRTPGRFHCAERMAQVQCERPVHSTAPKETRLYRTASMAA